MNATTIDDAGTDAIKARIAWLEGEEEQLGRTAYSAQQNGYVDEDARLWAEAERAEVRLEVLRLKASLEAGSDRVTSPTAAEEIRDMLSEVIHSDTVQGLLALRGRKTFFRLLLGVVPTHVAASVLPGTDAPNQETVRRLGLVNGKLGNKGGVVILDRLRQALAADEPPAKVKPPRGVGTSGRLKRSTLFD